MSKTIVSIIRERGQLTIPDAIRKNAPWVRPLSSVTLTVTPTEIVIRPQGDSSKKEWDLLWHSIGLSRSLRGKRVSLSEFITKQRES